MLRIADSWHGSDLGLQRQGNEDNYFVRAPLFVVADGMGGAQSGEVASEMAVEAFDAGLPDGDSPSDGLVRIIELANQRIHERSRAETQRAGMGTTVTAAYVGEDVVTIAHVGDSRCYLVRNGELRRLTVDHSLVGDLVRLGKLTEEQAESHPQRSVITRALGPEPNVQVDVETFEARAGDLFMVCSDGLTSMVREEQAQAAADRARASARRARARADRRRQRRRRARQHHRDPVHARGDRGARAVQGLGRRLGGRPGRGHAGVPDVRRRGVRRAAPGRHAARTAIRATPTRRVRPSGRAPPFVPPTTPRPSTATRGRSRCRRSARARSRSRRATRTLLRVRRRAGARASGGCSRPASCSSSAA